MGSLSTHMPRELLTRQCVSQCINQCTFMCSIWTAVQGMDDVMAERQGAEPGAFYKRVSIVHEYNNCADEVTYPPGGLSVSFGIQRDPFGD